MCKRLISFFILFCIVLPLWGCETSDTNVQELNTTMYFHKVQALDGFISEQYQGEVSATITKNDGTEDSIDIRFPIPPNQSGMLDVENLVYDFTLHQHDQIAFCCAKGWVYDPATDHRTLLYDVALDLEHQFMIFQLTGDTAFYVVASADPEVDPETIVAHFEHFLELHSSQ